MQALIDNLSHYIQRVYQKAGGFIEEQREFAVSQVFLNATLKKFVTDNVGLLKDLHADLHDDWLRLYATIDIQGLHTTLFVDLKLLQMELNKTTQLLVFEQISQTQILDATYKNKLQQWGIQSALFFYQKMLKKDPLGKILQHFNVLTVKDELLHLDLNQWLGKNQSILDTLNKVRVNHAVLRETELVLKGNLNLSAMMNKVADTEIKDKA
ncbi:hypothetical protein I2F27_11585 [Acinetobacter sp. B5B]|uniref:hypothetical protein n=1 Tax=Acinetobacter baretiae TaxID=2605383 RepID=UPI0018C3413B|nr:hypothetical protein [Acinetobacter baretiae]MBF7683959.1 hypothetical protein [Acinetobacter baretiae]MBF7685555.1 hypothetical protein [Acinetobacter baretiae]